MVLSLIKKINISELQSYIRTMRYSYISTQGLILQPKFGTATFNFEKNIGQKCCITLKRDAGNGFVIISSNGRSYNYQIASKQTITIDIEGDGNIVLNRTLRSKGDISVLDISLYCETKTKQEFNNILSRCIDHNCIRFLDDRLIASSGAFIKGKNIVVKTEPEESYIKEVDKVVFVSSCTILDISVDGVSNKGNLSLPLNAVADKTPGVVLYNSDLSGFSQKYCLNDSVVNEFGISLGYRDSYVFPLECLKQNIKSTIIIEASSVSGNGMFGFGLVPGNDAVWQVASKEQKEFILEVIPQTSDNYCLSILRHPSAKGTVIISNISVVSDSYYSMITSKEIIPFIDRRENINKECKTKIEYNQDSITDLSIYFSRPILMDYKSNSLNNIISTIGIGSIQGRNWYNTVKYILPNVTINDSPNSSISCLGNLIPAKKMYIENFKPEILTDDDVVKMDVAESIFVSSNSNLQILSEKINKKIKVISKILPTADQSNIKYISGEFVLLNNSNKAQDIIDKLKDTGIKVVLLNARGKYPSFVIPVNEYIQHNELIYLINNAKCLINFTNVEDEVSNYTDLALVYGTQVITSSWAYMENRDVFFINDISVLPSFIEKSSKKTKQPDLFSLFINEFLS